MLSNILLSINAWILNSLLTGKRFINSAKGSSLLLEYFKGYVDSLHNAALTGDIDTVRDFIENKKWCPLMLDRHGNNTLHNAAKNGQLETVKYLTGSCTTSSQVLCDPSIKNKSGLTAQDLASQGGHHQVESYLVRDHCFKSACVKTTCTLTLYNHVCPG